MPKPDGQQFTELHLFDPSQYDEEKTPGQMNMDEWLATQNPMFHGTFRPDFGNAPTAHYGTMGAATNNLKKQGIELESSQLLAARYYDPSITKLSDDHPSVDDDHIGRIYARRFKVEPFNAPFSDGAANAADLVHRILEANEDPMKVPITVRSSAYGVRVDPDGIKITRGEDMTRKGAKALAEGKPILYDNTSEHTSSVDAKYPFGPDLEKYKYPRNVEDRSLSAVAPRGSVSSWERDVLEDPKSSIFAKQFAQQRIDQGKEGAVPFPDPDAPLKEVPAHLQTKLMIRNGVLSQGIDVMLPSLTHPDDEVLNLVDEHRVPGASARRPRSNFDKKASISLDEV